MAQLSFTIGVHGRELRRLPERAYARRATNTAIVAVSLVLILTLEATHAGLSYGEILYRCFMSFYGLVFPAYVWLVMIPTSDGHSGLGGENGRRKLFIWAFTVGVAATMFWMGFIERSEVWLAPGLAIVLCARFVLPGWYGVGSGIRKAVEQFGESAVREMFTEWYFQRSLKADTGMVLAKSDLDIAKLYSQLAGDLHEEFFPIIEDEYPLTRDLFLE